MGSYKKELTVNSQSSHRGDGAHNIVRLATVLAFIRNGDPLQSQTPILQDTHAIFKIIIVKHQLN